MNDTLTKMEILRNTSGLVHIQFDPKGICFHYYCSEMFSDLGWGSAYLVSELYADMEQGIIREFELHLIGWRIQDDRIYTTRRTFK